MISVMTLRLPRSVLRWRNLFAWPIEEVHMSGTRGGWPLGPRRRTGQGAKRPLIVAVALALVLALGRPAGAQTEGMQDLGFAIDRFEPAERGSDWFVLESLDFGSGLRPSIGLVADWASRPLVVYDPDDEVKTRIVESQLLTHAGVSLAIAGVVRFAVSVPVVLTQSGDAAMVGDTTVPAP